MLQVQFLGPQLMGPYWARLHSSTRIMTAVLDDGELFEETDTDGLDSIVGATESDKVTPDIMSGMLANVDIAGGKRTVLDYVLKPMRENASSIDGKLALACKCQLG